MLLYKANFVYMYEYILQMYNEKENMGQIRCLIELNNNQTAWWNTFYKTIVTKYLLPGHSKGLLTPGKEK